MSKNKKGFVLYADQKELFDKLPNEKAGELIKHIFKYVNDEDPETDDLIIDLAFTPIKQQLKRDLEKWEGIKRSRSNAGKASVEARKLIKEQISTKSTSVKSVKQTSTKPTVIVNDNVNVNVNDNVNDNVNVKVIVNDTNKQVSEICNFAWPLFPEDIRPKEKNKGWTDTIDKLIRIDGKDPREIKQVIAWARADDFWVKNFLSLTKLRNKDKNDIKYYDVFNQNRKSYGSKKDTRRFSKINDGGWAGS